MGAPIQMRVYDDRLSIWNEGGLPFGLTLEELKVEHNSRPRNPIIAKACFMAGYIDTWGRGTIRIIDACKEHGLPEPEIDEKNGGLSVTVFKAKTTVSADDGDGKGGQISGQIGGQIGGQIDFSENSKDQKSIDNDKNGGLIGGSNGGLIGGLIQLTDRQKQILEIIRKNSKTTIKNIAKQLEINTTAVDKHIDALKRKGVLKRIGGTRGYWQIKYPDKN
jgi:ATP-dependent DNA helicase RecG